MHHLLRALAALSLLSGCGGAQTEAVVTSPFTGEDAVVFEDGVDFVFDPDVLEGRWREDWSRELQQRVERADIVAVVRVATLRTDVDLDRRTTYRLIATVERELLGEPPQEEMSLVVREGEGGFESVRSNERRVLDGDFVAFVKWYQTEHESVAPHWHLSPATDPVLRRVEFLVRRRTQAEEEAQTTTRTIVHED